jgi:hypothetical protein
LPLKEARVPQDQLVPQARKDQLALQVLLVQPGLLAPRATLDQRGPQEPRAFKVQLDQLVPQEHKALKVILAQRVTLVRKAHQALLA